MSSLDDADALRAGDPQGLVDAYLRFGDQLRAAYGPASEATVDAGAIRSVVCAGMGGSAAAADVVAAVGAAEAPVGIFVRRGYRLPEWIGRDTLLLCLSYSGDTEETLAIYDEARSRGARVVTISAGGALAERAERDGGPHVALAAEAPQPRAALGSLTGAALGTLVAAGVLEDASEEVDATASALRGLALELAQDTPTEGNRAKQVASRIGSRIPVIWGSEGISEAAAWRWKTAFNENAEILAFSSSFPELDHNEVVGWSTASGSDFCVVVLREPDEHGSVEPRLRATLEQAASEDLEVVEVEAVGPSPLARALSLMAVGDVASAYHAIARGIDPAPIEALRRVKERLAEPS